MNVGLIVGLVVGGFVLLIVLGAIGLIVYASFDEQTTLGDDVQSFPDGQAALEALNAADVECEDITEENAAAGVLGLPAASSSASCQLGDSNVHVDVYPSSEDRQQVVHIFEVLFDECDGSGDSAAGNAKTLVAGENWIISVDDADFEDDPAGALAVSVALDADQFTGVCDP